MGVDISPGGASWAYGGFMRFRERLAKAEGFDLKEMQGFGGKGDWDDHPEGLKYLLNHSDCDGYLDSWECAEILPRLKEIIETWSTADGYDYDAEQARCLIAGMEHSVEHGCAVRFH